jgi:hypothetical protein
MSLTENVVVLQSNEAVRGQETLMVHFKMKDAASAAEVMQCWLRSEYTEKSNEKQHESP